MSEIRSENRGSVGVGLIIARSRVDLSAIANFEKLVKFTGTERIERDRSDAGAPSSCCSSQQRCETRRLRPLVIERPVFHERIPGAA